MFIIKITDFDPFTAETPGNGQENLTGKIKVMLPPLAVTVGVADMSMGGGGVLPEARLVGDVDALSVNIDLGDNVLPVSKVIDYLAKNIIGLKTVHGQVQAELDKAVEQYHKENNNVD